MAYLEIEEISRQVGIIGGTVCSRINRGIYRRIFYLSGRQEPFTFTEEPPASLGTHPPTGGAGWMQLFLGRKSNGERLVMDPTEAHVGSLDANGALELLSRVAAPIVINALSSEDRVLALTKSQQGCAFRRVLSDPSVDPVIIAALESSERRILMDRKLGKPLKLLLMRFTALCRQFEVELESVPKTLLAMALYQNEEGARARVTIAQQYGNLPECGETEQYLIGAALSQTTQGAIARNTIASRYRLQAREDPDDLSSGSEPSFWKRFVSGLLLFGPRQDQPCPVRDRFVSASNVVPALAGYSTGSRAEMEQYLTEFGLLDPTDDEEVLFENVYTHLPPGS